MPTQEANKSQEKKVSKSPKNENPLKKVSSPVPLTVLKFNKDESQREVRDKQ